MYRNYVFMVNIVRYNICKSSFSVCIGQWIAYMHNPLLTSVLLNIHISHKMKHMALINPLLKTRKVPLIWCRFACQWQRNLNFEKHKAKRIYFKVTNHEKKLLKNAWPCTHSNSFITIIKGYLPLCNPDT